MISIGDESKCTLCGACYDCCSVGAIDFTHKAYNGFLYPAIDENKCIKCGKCIKICPENSENYNKKNGFIRSCIAYYNDSTALLESASGGVFRAIGSYIIEKNGICFGAVWQGLKVKIVSADKIDELSPMSGSKYVQSSMEGVYVEIEKALKTGRLVAVTALPCQIAGIRSFLKKDYDNLILIDIVCHGCASENLFKRYMDYNIIHIGEINSINQTDKKNGWTKLIQRTILYKTKDNIYYVNSHDDPYLECFLSNLFFKNSCYNCSYNRMPRQGDLTIGDCFGVGTINKNMIVNKNGLSHIVVNNIKGSKLLDEISDRLIYQVNDIRENLYFNHNLWKSSRPDSRYMDFRRDYETCSTSTLINLYYNTRVKKIKRKINSIIKILLGESGTCRLMLIVYKLNGIIDKANNVYKKINSDNGKGMSNDK